MEGFSFRNIKNTPEEKDKFLKFIYDGFVSGIHDDVDLSNPLNPKFRRGASFGGRLADAHRVLFYKDAASELKQIRQYGLGTLNDSIHEDIQQIAKKLSIARTMGANAEYNYQWIRRIVRDKNKLTAHVKYKLWWTDNLWKLLNGTDNTPVSSKIAWISGALTRFNNVTKLPFVVLHSLNDMALGAKEQVNRGNSVFTAWSHVLKNQAKLFSMTREQKEFYDLLGHAAHNIIGGFDRFGGNNQISGLGRKIDAIFFKMTGLPRWDYVQRQSAQAALARDFAINKDLSFNGLHVGFREDMLSHGIGKKEWDLIRKMPLKAVDGTLHITPDAVRQATKEDIAEYLGKPIDKITDEMQKNTIDDIETALFAYGYDIANNVVLYPTAATKSTIYLGARAGTPLGTIMRLIGQYKMFPIGFTRKIMGKTFFGATSKRAALMGFMHLAAGMVIWKYIGDSAVDLLKGRTPKDPAKMKTHQDRMLFYRKTLSPAFGMIGDLMGGELSRYGGGLGDIAFGPTYSNANDLAKIAGVIMDGKNPTKMMKALAERNVPFLNLWGFNTALKYMFLKALGDKMDEMSYEKSARRLKYKYGQEQIFNPFK